MIFGKSARRALRLIVILTTPLAVAGCLPIFNSGTSGGLKYDVAVSNGSGGGQGRASGCDVLNEFDLRVSRHDTLPTQMTLFGLQRIKARCVGADAGGRNGGE